MRKQEDLNYYIKSRNIKDVEKFYKFLTMKGLEKFCAVKFYDDYCEIANYPIKGQQLFFDPSNLLIKIYYEKSYYKDGVFNKFESILGKRIEREDKNSL